MRQNTKGEKSKEKLIKCAASLFLRQGYSATGCNDILKDAGLPKGSFYYHFASKKDLAMDVAEYYKTFKMNQVVEAAKKGRTWDAFVEKLVGDLIEVTKQQKNFGCPIAVLGMEIAFLEPDIAEKYKAGITNGVHIFADVLKKSGLPEEKAIILADRAFAMYEGRLLFFRISKDINELEKLIIDMKAIGKHY